MTIVIVGSTSGSSSGGSLISSLSTMAEVYEDWLGGNAVGSTGWAAATTSGAGANGAMLAAEAAHPGIVRYSTGTTATGRAKNRKSADFLMLGGGAVTFEYLVRLSALSTGTERYTVDIGLGDAVVAGEDTDAVKFRYNDSVAGGDWQGVCRSNGTETILDTGVIPVAGAWTRLRGVVNADATSVEFFINGTSVGTVATNIPAAAGRELSLKFGIEKSIGLTNVDLDVDYIYLMKAVTR